MPMSTASKRGSETRSTNSAFPEKPKMTKIVYNGCPGGFDLSYRGVMRYAEIRGMKLFAFTDKRDEKGIIRLGEKKVRVTSPEEAKDAFSIYYYTSEDQSDDNYFNVNGIDRGDPALVQVVEELGSAANGIHADLHIAELPSRALYRIDAYDGRESVRTNYDYEWNIAP